MTIAFTDGPLPKGVTDVGGTGAGGPLPDPAAAAESFHYDWERHFYALWFALVSYSRSSGDTRFLRAGPGVRWAMEQTEPALYFAQSYYERFLYPIERAAVASGVTTWEDLAARSAQAFETPPTRPEGTSKHAPTGPEMQVQMLRNMAPGLDGPPPAFSPGDRVIARGTGVPGHTRLPGYVQGHTGRIVALRGTFNQNDVLAMEGVLRPEAVYTVAFDARDLWGPDADPRDSVTIEAFESYLAAAPETVDD